MPWSDEWDEQLYAEGYQTGQNWTRHSASRGELRRLRRFYESLQPLDWDIWWVSAVGQTSEALAVMSTIDPASEHDPQAAREYWEQIAERSDSDVWETEFALGFTEGAIEVEPSVQVDVSVDTDANERAHKERRSDTESIRTDAGPPPGLEEFGKATDTRDRVIKNRRIPLPQTPSGENSRKKSRMS